MTDSERSVVSRARLTDSKGGSEGDGEDVELVIQFPSTDGGISPDILVKFEGYYSSYDGTTWEDDITQVFPKQKTITVYEPEIKLS